MDNIPKTVPIENRRCKTIPFDKIKVIGYRVCDKERFEQIVESMNFVPLFKPDRVNDKFLNECNGGN